MIFTTAIIMLYQVIFNIDVCTHILQLFGWPDAPIEDIVEAVIRRCGHEPLTSDCKLSSDERLRENIKCLFMVVIEDNRVKSLLTRNTIDDVIVHVLKLSKETNL